MAVGVVFWVAGGRYPATFLCRQAQTRYFWNWRPENSQRINPGLKSIWWEYSQPGLGVAFLTLLFFNKPRNISQEGGFLWTYWAAFFMADSGGLQLSRAQVRLAILCTLADEVLGRGFSYYQVSWWKVSWMGQTLHCPAQRPHNRERESRAWTWGPYRCTAGLNWAEAKAGPGVFAGSLLNWTLLTLT